MADHPAYPGTDPAAALATVLALHRPVRRYKACFRDERTYPTAKRAYEVNLADPMRGYESIALNGPEDAEFIEVCAECCRVENAGAPEAEDDETEGTALDTAASAWPCATYTAIRRTAEQEQR